MCDTIYKVTRSFNKKTNTMYPLEIQKALFTAKIAEITSLAKSLGMEDSPTLNKLSDLEKLFENKTINSVTTQGKIVRIRAMAVGYLMAKNSERDVMFQKTSEAVTIAEIVMMEFIRQK